MWNAYNQVKFEVRDLNGGRNILINWEGAIEVIYH